MVIIIILLIVGIILFTTLYTLQTNSNYKNSSQSQLLPFSGVLGYNENGTGGTPIDASGALSPQLICPAGKSINILGAYYQVVDPYQVCSNSPDPLLTAACIPGQGTLPCDPNGANVCMPGFSCQNGKCSLTAYSSQSDAQNDLNKLMATVDQGDSSQSFGLTPVQFQGDNNWYLINPTMCGYTLGANNILAESIPSTLQNSVCTPSNSNTRCAIRDCSAYLAGKYNGKNSANPTLMDVGPYPCAMSLPLQGGCNVQWTSNGTNQFPVSGGSGSNSYCALPLTPGSTSNPNNLAQSGWTPNASFNLGYYVHGLYTCV